MSKPNPHFSINEDKDDLKEKGHDALYPSPSNLTPGLAKDDSSTMVDRDVGGDIKIISLPERAMVKLEETIRNISMSPVWKLGWMSSIWAILISINGYKKHPLSGCMSDAQLMKDYLINHAKVLADHIQCLLSPSEGNVDRSGDSSLLPTQHNIIETLLSLADNKWILRGSDIIIYYAGHGTSYPDPTGTTETLCPIDHDAETCCHDISDQEINEILHRISCSKGNRITVILDCCYSGGATRGVDQEWSWFWSIPPLPNVSARSTLRTADDDLHLLGSNRSVLASGWHPIMDSHVVLAACRNTERARDMPGSGSEGWNGAFTVALLDALKSKLLTWQSTYIDLLNILVVDGQKPVLAGKHKYSQLGDLKRF